MYHGFTSSRLMFATKGQFKGPLPVELTEAVAALCRSSQLPVQVLLLLSVLFWARTIPLRKAPTYVISERMSNRQ